MGTGSQEPAPGEPTRPSDAAKPKVDLGFLSWYSQDKNMDRYVGEKFEALHPRISVNSVTVGGRDLLDKVRVSLTASDGALRGI